MAKAKKKISPRLRITKLSDFKLDPQNANQHTERGENLLADSLRNRKFFRPVAAVGDDTIMAGNSTIAQASGLGMDEAIVIETDGTRPIIHKRIDIKSHTSKEARRLALEDNRVAELSLNWNDAILADLAQDDDILDGLWDEKEIAALGVETLPENDDERAAELVDKAEELQKKWKVRPGDTWQIGEHFIICGDCTNFDDWKKLLTAAGIEKVNGVFTSPPYAEQRKKQYGGIPTDKYVEWWYDVQANVRAHLAEDGSFFVNIKPHCEKGERVLYVFDLVLAMRRKWEWMFVEEFVWYKPGIPPSFNKKQFRDRWEPIFLFTTHDNYKINRMAVGVASENTIIPNSYSKRSNAGSGEGLFRADTKIGLAIPGNVVHAAGSEGGHAAAFPITLPEFFIKAYSDEGDIWLDPFLGSGTTICAAQRNSRRGLGIEKLEKYVAVCLERISDLTGKQPKLLNGNKK